jgi:hypothetical protein
MFPEIDFDESDKIFEINVTAMLRADPGTRAYAGAHWRVGPPPGCSNAACSPAGYRACPVSSWPPAMSRRRAD